MIIELAAFHPKLRGRNVNTYEDLMAYPFGRLGSGFILLNMFFLSYGAMVAYLLIIKDTVPTILGLGDGFVQREVMVVVASMFLIVPLALQRDMASLAFTSLLSVTADIILVGFIVAYSPWQDNVAAAGGFGEVLATESVNSTLFIGLGILSTAMACQHSAFIVSGSLENKTSARWSSVTFRSILLSTLLSAVMGIFGYLGYLEGTRGDILNNFPRDSIESNAARTLLAITMVFTYPMELFVARHVFVKLLFSGDMDGPVDELGRPHRTFGCFGRREKLTIIIYMTTIIPALIFDDIGPVLSVSGSLGGSLLSYVAPGMVYLGVNGDSFLAYMANLVDSRQKKSSKPDASNGDIELPVVGDANQVMRTEAPPSYPTGSKPWWWFPTLMPIWCALASAGAMSMRNRMTPGENQTSPRQQEGVEEVEVIHPNPRDYWISIFFIVFGVVGVVAGLGSNIWVQVNNTFFSPH